MRELKTKDALILTGLLLCGFITYTIGGVFLKGFSASLINFIESLLGYLCLSIFILSGINDFSLATKRGALSWIKYSAPIISSAYSMMYFLYLAYNFGDLNPHISAIGFSLAALLYSINHIIISNYKLK